MGKSDVRSSVFRVLATYAGACFVILQTMDIAQEPLGLPVAATRWVLLAMISLAPLLVLVFGWRSLKRSGMTPDNTVQTGPDAVFAIGNAELDTAQRQLRFAGVPVDVQPKVFDLIELLVRARDRVVGKDELFDNIWPDVVVTEASLTQSIKRARDLFRQNGFDADVIRTIPRKGYQLACSVEVVNAVGAERPTKRSEIVLLAAPISLVAAILGFLVWNSNDEPGYSPITSNAANSLVVLPFTDLTPERDFGYFSDGLTETLTDTLTTVDNLRVIAHGSASSVENLAANYPNIGDELNVAHIVEGSVQRSEDELRISARLITAQDGRQIWSQIYSRKFDDVFAIQDDISQAVVDQMSELLSMRLVLAARTDGPIDDASAAEAYRLLLLGRDQRKQGSTEELQAAADYFRAALELVPNYPAAMLGLADALRYQAVVGELPREATFTEALGLLNEALAIQPDFADAYVQLGEIQHRHFWNFSDAAESYATALELRPGNAPAHAAYSRFLSKTGRYADSVAQAEIALDLDPKSARAASSLAIRLIRARRLDDARAIIDTMTAEHPGHADLPWLETNWHLGNSTFRDALTWVAQEELDYLRLCLSAIALHRLDRKAQALEALDELIDTDSEGATFQIAEVYAQWGESDQAFVWLERAFSQGDPGMAELYSSINLQSLSADPRFAALAERIGLPPLNPS